MARIESIACNNNIYFFEKETQMEKNLKENNGYE